jgi:hypothetical protein
MKMLLRWVVVPLVVTLLFECFQQANCAFSQLNYETGVTGNIGTTNYASFRVSGNGLAAVGCSQYDNG